MSDKLKPCEYCKGEVVLREFRASLEFATECISCWARGPIVETIEEVFDKHNTRPFEDHAVEVLACELWSHDEDNKYATLEEARAEAKKLLGVK